MSKKIAIYVRVSSANALRGKDGADRDDTSLDSQESRCRQWLAAQQLSGNIEVYRDEAVSGGTTNRPAFQRLMADVAAGRVAVAVFPDLSRMSRNIRDALRISEAFEEAGVRWTCLKENFDTSTAGGRLLFNIFGSLAEFEREQTGERLSAALRDRASRGIWAGGHPPRGYSRAAGVPGGIAPNADAPVVKRAFEAYLQAGSIAKTVLRLEAEGVKPTGRAGWTTTGLSEMLDQPAYVGRKRLEDGRIIDALWSPIVDQGLWDRVRAVRAANAAAASNTVTGKGAFFYLLSGLTRCSECGGRMAGSVSHRKVASGRANHLYYRHAQGTALRCKRGVVRADDLEATVVEAVRRVATDPALIAQVERSITVAMASGVPDAERAVAEARRQWRELDNRHKAVLHNLLSAPAGAVPESFWAAAKTVESDVAAAAERVREAEAALTTAQATSYDMGTALDVYRQLDSVWDALTDPERAELLRSMIVAVHVGIDEVTVEFHSWIGLPDGRLTAKSPAPRRASAKLQSQRSSALGQMLCNITLTIPLPRSRKARG